MQQPQNYYGSLACLAYDLDKPVGRSFGDVEYYMQRLQGVRGPVLEPAVGNGRVLIPLQQAGLDMIGFDSSDEMLSLLHQHGRRCGLSVQADRRRFEDFSYEQRFAAAIIPAGSLQLITETDGAIHFLRRIRDHLLPEGRLIFDLDPVDAFLSPAGSSSVRSWTTPDGSLLTLQEMQEEVDYVQQTTTSHLRYDLWVNGRLQESEHQLFRLRWWGVTEMKFVLKEAGFTDIAVCGNYTYGRTPRQRDHVITFEALRSG